MDVAGPEYDESVAQITFQASKHNADANNLQAAAHKQCDQSDEARPSNF
jgi:hypothetical protein